VAADEVDAHPDTGTPPTDSSSTLLIVRRLAAKQKAVAAPAGMQWRIACIDVTGCPSRLSGLHVSTASGRSVREQSIICSF
jgi:hypothetical protein